MENNRPDGREPAVTVAIYARDAQGDPSSLDDQISACRAYADQRGWRIDDTLVFTDAGVSGATTTGRPGLAGLLDSAQRIPQPFTGVLMRDTSRLGRRFVDVLNIIDLLEYHGVSIVFVDQELDSDSKGFDDVLRGYPARDAAFHQSLSHVVRRSQKARVKEGFVHGGRCFGYDHVPVLDPTRMSGGRPAVVGVRAVINEAEAAIIRRIFELRGEGWSLNHIANLLNADVIPSSGNAFLGWTSSKVHAILNSMRFLGRLLYGRTRRLRNPETGKTVARPRPRAEWLVRESPDLRIVSDELWRKAHSCSNRWGGRR